MKLLENEWEAPPVPFNLKCEYLCNPAGIDAVKPRLSWICESPGRGQKQTAYQIIVSDSTEKIDSDSGNIWDSERIESGQSAHVVYSGKELESGKKYFWKVRIWDKNGKQSQFSDAASWSMGLLKENNWIPAKWIGIGDDISPDSPEAIKAPYLRKEMFISGQVKSASAYICGLGYYELYLNGKKVGENILDPGFTSFDRRVLYSTYDISGSIEQGKNCFAVILGNGYYNQHSEDAWDFHKAPWRNTPRMIMKILLEYAGGRVESVVSDETWKISDGPIVFNGTRNGEVYDARLERNGWNKPDYNDGDWRNAGLVKAPAGKLCAQMCQPVRIMETLRTKSVKEVKPGIFVFDMGQNFAGFAELKVKGPSGTEVKLKYGEELFNDGMVSQAKLNWFVKPPKPFQTDTYILKGEGTEIWHPRFTYHGFRYVQVEGFPGTPKLANLCGKVVHSSFKNTGRFECSNKLFNKIQKNTLWTYRSNFHSIPTDCPHREKTGWTADAHLATEAGLLNFNSESCYTKWMNDIYDEQKETGELPGVVPTGGWSLAWGKHGPAWDSAYVMIIWYLYLYRGDIRIIEVHYEKMKRYLGFLKTNSGEERIVRWGLGDWIPPYGYQDDYTVPMALTSTSYFYETANLLSKMAKLLGKNEDFANFAELAEKIRESINRKYFGKEFGIYANGSQSSQATAIFYNFPGTEDKGKVFQQLIADLKRHKWHLNCGIHSTKYLLNSLTEYGRADLACRVVNNKTYPSWGWCIGHGATTIWETWDGNASLNHIAFGDVSAWFFKALAGINTDAEFPGFKRFVIKPNPVGRVRWVDSEIETVYGKITTSWKTEKDYFILNVKVPFNTTAIVHIPTSDPDSVMENEKPVENSDVIKIVKKEKEKLVLSVDSGGYIFKSIFKIKSK